MFKAIAKGIAMRLVIRAVIALVGLAVVLVYWTFTGRSSKNNNAAHSDKMPARILGGGGPKVTIDVDTTSPATVSFMGDLPSKPNGEQPTEEDAEKVEAGHHTWTIELAPKTSGEFQLEAVNPQVGARLSWNVSLDGKEIANESDTLDKPLAAGYAFFLQARIPEEGEESTTTDSHP